MIVVAYSALLYGADFLNHAIRSIIDDVDSYVVLYSAIGSHGHRSDAICPDTRETLYDIALNAAGDKLRWFDGTWSHEGAQRDNIFSIVPEADVIVVLDADEVWSPGLLKDALRETYHLGIRDIRIPFTHYWRSLKQAILHDPAFPVRLIYPKNASGAETFTPHSFLAQPYRTINHYGYAQRSEIVRYKLETHGHRSEIRRDCNWFEDIFMNVERKTDLHLVGSDYWSWEEIEIPGFMKDHPYAQLELIE